MTLQSSEFPSQRQKKQARAEGPLQGGSKPGETSLEPQRMIIKAWSPLSGRRTPLLDAFAHSGGGYVWRHEDLFTHWYYVGEKIVLEYRIRRRESTSTDSDLQQVKTVISKQWIYRDILEQAGYGFKEYGEGHYSIDGELTPVSL